MVNGVVDPAVALTWVWFLEKFGPPVVTALVISLVGVILLERRKRSELVFGELGKKRAGVFVDIFGALLQLDARAEEWVGELQTDRGDAIPTVTKKNRENVIGIALVRSLRAIEGAYVGKRLPIDHTGLVAQAIALREQIMAQRFLLGEPGYAVALSYLLLLERRLIPGVVDEWERTTQPAFAKLRVALSSFLPHVEAHSRVRAWIRGKLFLRAATRLAKEEAKIDVSAMLSRLAKEEAERRARLPQASAATGAKPGTGA